MTGKDYSVSATGVQGGQVQIAGAFSQQTMVAGTASVGNDQAKAFLDVLERIAAIADARGIATADAAMARTAIERATAELDKPDGEPKRWIEVALNALGNLVGSGLVAIGVSLFG